MNTTLLGTNIDDPSLDIISNLVHSFICDTFKRIEDSSVVEIEAKFGLLIDVNTRCRIVLPVLNAVVMDPSAEGSWFRFDSEIGMNRHSGFNNILNERFQKEPNRWKYHRHRNTDYIISLTGQRTRISRDTKTGRLLSIIRKNRIADLAIHVPNSSMDLRISVNTEVHLHDDGSLGINPEREGPLEMSATSRRKDRISYQIDDGFLSIDLTQVRQDDALKHELEVEIGKPLSIVKDPRLCHSFVRNLLDMAVNR